jgi:hypothetical protein
MDIMPDDAECPIADAASAATTPAKGDNLPFNSNSFDR